MDVVLLLGRVILAGVFLVAGVGKLLDMPGSRRAMIDFGLPSPLAHVAGTALPAVELCLAVLLLPVATAWWGALVATLLLLAFIAGIARSLSQGRTPDCHCFGRIHSEPAGPSTLIRNTALAALAATVVLFGRSDPGPSIIAWTGDLSGTEVAGLVFVTVVTATLAGLGWLVTQLMLQNGRLLLRVDALEEALTSGGSGPVTQEPAIRPGVAAPAFTLPNLDGVSISLGDLRQAALPTLLVFSDPNCGACSRLLPDLANWQADGRLIVALISRGSASANRAKVAEAGLLNVLLQEDREIAVAYGADVTPAAVLIGADGLVASSIVRGTEDIRALVARTLRPSSVASSSYVPTTPLVSHAPGMPAPGLSLPNLNGQVVSLDAYRGTDTVVLFWNPACGYCQRLLPEILAWESNPPEHAPALLIVSQGSVVANRELGFRSQVLLGDPRAGIPFGVRGTPGAVVVDRNGTIASDVAIGAPAVLGLLNPVAALP